MTFNSKTTERPNIFFMAIFIVLWSCLFTSKLRCLQKYKSGHTNLKYFVAKRSEFSLTFLVVNKVFLLFLLSEDEISWEHFRLFETTSRKSVELLRKYTKMLKTDSFLGIKKLSLNQNFWSDICYITNFCFYNLVAGQHAAEGWHYQDLGRGGQNVINA